MYVVLESIILLIHTSRAASIMVVICERSPHSAKNVNVNDCMITAGHNRKHHRRHHILLLRGGVDVTTPFSTSSSYKNIMYIVCKKLLTSFALFNSSFTASNSSFPSSGLIL